MKETFSKESNINKIECEFLEVIHKTESTFPYRPYTEYTIFLNIKTKYWKIRKRYSDFVTLNNELAESIYNLPQLPKKALFQFRKSVIEERKRSLESYLVLILSHLNLFKHKCVLDFIQLDLGMLYNLHKCYTLVEKNQDARSTKSSTFELLFSFSSYHISVPVSPPSGPMSPLQRCLCSKFITEGPIHFVPLKNLPMELT